MTKRPPPISVRLFTEFAQHQADCEHVPADQRPQFVDRAVRCFSTVLSQRFGGERVLLCAPRIPSHERLARRLRISVALRMGESPAAIAKREGVTADLVRKIRARKNVP